jgi:hypothetical protein
MKDCLSSLIGALLFWALVASPLQADASTSEFEKLIGRPVDIAPSAYQFRADRAAAENAPETEFLFIALKHTKAETLCGLLWEEPRPVKTIVLEWPASAPSIPKPDALVLRWYPSANSASWWSRSKKGSQLHQADNPSVSADGRQYTYTLDALANEDALDNLVVAVKAGAESLKSAEAPIVRVLAPQTWKPLEIVVEWGFQDGSGAAPFDGQIEAYNGILGAATPLEADEGTTMTGARAWQSRPSGTSRRGIAVRLLHVGYSDSAIWPGQANLDDVNRTIVTLRTKSGSFSFLPADLEKGPILAPEYGFYVAEASNPKTARQFQAELKAQGGQTLREQIHARAEQTWEGAMRAVHTEIQGDFPPYPEPQVSAPMTVEVPEPYLTAAWKIGATNLFRGSKQDELGRWQFRDHPYEALAHETQLLLRALDLMGKHKEARDGYEMWLDRAEKPVPLPQGMWVGGPATFFSGVDWDNAHCGGISLIHLGMLDHYELTRDDAWLRKNLAKLHANADWIIAQCKQFSAAQPGHEKLWFHGLLPPHNTWDFDVWRSWYESNATYCHALARHAEVVAKFDPQAARRYAGEAENFRQDILTAVEKSLVLSPVIRVRDGTYRSFLPAAPYMRGPASRFMPTNFSMPNYPQHTPGLYADAVRGGQYLLEFGILPASDRRAIGYLDVLEDRLLSENFKIGQRFKDYDPQKDWFSRSGWYYQCGLERTANIYLLWDDPACFLRTWFNQFAIEILPGVWHFKEHTAMHDCMDKPYEEAAFLERFRGMLIREDGETLWLAQAAPRKWFGQGENISVKNAPTNFGIVNYQTQSDVEHGKILATLDMPSRNPPSVLVLRLRHPQALALKTVTVNGRPWNDFNAAKETIRLHGLKGNVKVVAEF